MSDGAGPTPPREQPRSEREHWPWLRAFLGVVVLIVLPAVLLYLWFSISQRTTLVRRNFRALETIAARFQDQISNAETSLRNLGRAKDERTKEVKLDAFLREAAHLDLDSKPEGPMSRSSRRRSRAESRDVTSEEGCSVKLSVTESGSGSPRRLVYELVADGPKGRAGCRLAGLRATRSVVDSAGLDRLPRGFDGLMLLDKNLEVIAQRGEWQDIVVRRPSLVDAKGAPAAVGRLLDAGGDAAGGATEATSGQSAGWIDYILDRSRAASTSVGAPGLPKATILDSEYWVFPVPLRLSVKRGTVAPGSELVLLGLVREERFRRETAALGPSLLVLVGSAIVALLLALPYVKIRFMGRFERLRAIDMWLLAASAYFGTSLATITGLHLIANRELLAQTDADLRSLAQRIQREVHLEVGHALQQLEITSTELAQSKELQVEHFLTGERETLRYPFFDSIFLTDREGWQMHSAVAGVRAAPLWTVRDRSYFRDALALPRAAASGAAPFQYVFDSVDSMATGAEIHVLATHYRFARSGRILFGGSAEPLQRDGVAVLGAELESLSRPLLPEPFRFVVVEPDGRVLARSDERRNRREDFFEETGSARPTLAVSNGCDAVARSMRVLGRVQRFVTCPLPDLPVGPVPTRPATLVVYYDQHFVAGLSSDLFVMSAFWSSLAGLACCLAAVLARLTDPSSIDWLWPTIRRTRAYLAAAVALGLGAAVAVLWALHSEGSAIGYALIGIPAVVVLVGPRVARLSTRVRFLREIAEDAPLTAWERRLHPFAYLAFTTVGLCAIAMAPAYVAFRNAFDAQQLGLRATIDRGFEEARTARDACRAARFVTVAEKPSGDSKPAEAPSRPGRAGAVACEAGPSVLITEENFAKLEPSPENKDYGLFVPEPHATALGSAPVARDDCLAFFRFDTEALPSKHFSLAAGSCLPALSDVALRVRHESAAVAPPPVGAGPHSQSAASPPPGPWPLIGRSWLVLVAAGVLAFFVSVSKRILGLDIEGDGVVDRRPEVEAAIAAVAGGSPRRWLLIDPPGSIVMRLRALSSLPNVEVLDLVYRAPEDAAAAIAAVAGRTLVVLGLERCFASAACRRELPRALGRIVPQCSVFLVSERDPMSILASQAGSDLLPAGNAPGEIAAWSGALRGFESARFAVRSEATAAEELGVSSAPTQHVARLRRLVADETRWSDELFAIGQSLVARPDFGDFDARRVEEHLLDAASPLYHALWDGCSEDEKLVLVQLAQEGLVNPRRADTLRRLRSRRLVRASPRFAPMSRSFRLFVLGAITPEQLARWERPAGVAGAALVRGLLLVLATVAAILLVLTQQSFITTTLGIASAAAGVVGSVQAVALRFYGARSTS